MVDINCILLYLVQKAEEADVTQMSEDLLSIPAWFRDFKEVEKT